MKIKRSEFNEYINLLIIIKASKDYWPPHLKTMLEQALVKIKHEQDKRKKP